MITKYYDFILEKRSNDKRDDVIIKRFTLSTDDETIYVPVDFQ